MNYPSPREIENERQRILLKYLSDHEIMRDAWDQLENICEDEAKEISCHMRMGNDEALGKYLRARLLAHVEFNVEVELLEFIQDHARESERIERETRYIFLTDQAG